MREKYCSELSALKFSFNFRNRRVQDLATVYSVGTVELSCVRKTLGSCRQRFRVTRRKRQAMTKRRGHRRLRRETCRSLG